MQGEAEDRARLVHIQWQLGYLGCLGVASITNRRELLLHRRKAHPNFRAQQEDGRTGEIGGDGPHRLLQAIGEDQESELEEEGVGRTVVVGAVEEAPTTKRGAAWIPDKHRELTVITGKASSMRGSRCGSHEAKMYTAAFRIPEFIVSLNGMISIKQYLKTTINSLDE